MTFDVWKQAKIQNGLEQLKTVPTRQENLDITLDDLNEYSKALDFYDQGKKADAKIIAKKLLKNYPEFTPALNLLKKL